MENKVKNKKSLGIKGDIIDSINDLETLFTEKINELEERIKQLEDKE
jgi:hypothetical protein